MILNCSAIQLTACVVFLSVVCGILYELLTPSGDSDDKSQSRKTRTAPRATTAVGNRDTGERKRHTGKSQRAGKNSTKALSKPVKNRPPVQRTKKETNK